MGCPVTLYTLQLFGGGVNYIITLDGITGLKCTG